MDRFPNVQGIRFERKSDLHGSCEVVKGLHGGQIDDDLSWSVRPQSGIDDAPAHLVTIQPEYTKFKRLVSVRLTTGRSAAGRSPVRCNTVLGSTPRGMLDTDHQRWQFG